MREGERERREFLLFLVLGVESLQFLNNKCEGQRRRQEEGAARPRARPGALRLEGRALNALEAKKPLRTAARWAKDALAENEAALRHMCRAARARGRVA